LPGTERRAGRASARFFAPLLSLALAGCTSTAGPGDAARETPVGRSLAPLSFFDYKPLDPASVKIQPEGLTVEQSWVLDLYTLFHSRDYKAFRLVLPDEAGEEQIGHLLIPPGDGPFPAVVAFEILDGPLDVSEGLAKALVNRGYAVARMERRALDLPHQNSGEVVRDRLREGVIDARRLLDWLVTHPKIDASRLAAAGVSIGSIQALLLTACDPRVRGGFYLMTGGNLAEILYDSSETPVRDFRDRRMAAHGWTTREEWLAGVRALTEPVDPLTYAAYLDPRALMMASGRFDTVIPSARAQELWQALGEPLWYKLPCGHYTVFPFFWWAVARGADHLDSLLRN
jgi:dienelactone hydrolase